MAMSDNAPSPRGMSTSFPLSGPAVGAGEGAVDNAFGDFRVGMGLNRGTCRRTLLTACRVLEPCGETFGL